MATLYVIATPIGNLGDISHRAIQVLGTVNVIACEDTRKTRVLLDRFGIKPRQRLLSYHEHNEEQGGRRILRRLAAGLDVALCSNAGYPCISDPGYRIVTAALDQGHRLEVIPGAGAVEPALLSSGLPTSSFTFKGFPPRKPGPRRRFLERELESPHTLVVFESPYRVGTLLELALVVLGDRRAAVCVELTKRFEAVHRGYLSDLAEAFTGRKVRGEVVVVIAGNHPKLIRKSDS
ncbi:MAG: 16S rRNA (cytidine(1402)-2'-O)-methyltransferase [Candidatus Eisenbacteria sp.]|nr:16S rRNA (cytidine(1402)-2'-O)-methyltransferase [Candidatus Eisenbacteria bacterium]